MQLYMCHDGPNQLFEVAQGKIWYQDSDGELLCLSARKLASAEYFYKPMSYKGDKMAVLLMNIGSSAEDLSFRFSDVPGLTGHICTVRDIWNRKDVGTFTDAYTASNLASHDSAFLMLTCHN